MAQDGLCILGENTVVKTNVLLESQVILVTGQNKVTWAGYCS